MGDGRFEPCQAGSPDPAPAPKPAPAPAPEKKPVPKAAPKAVPQLTSTGTFAHLPFGSVPICGVAAA